MEYYSAIKENEIIPFAVTWMGLDTVILCEVSQTEKKYHMTSFICGISKKIWYKWTYLQNKNRLTDLENEFMVAMVVGGRRIGERKNRGKGRIGESLGWTHTHCYILNG